MKLNKGPCPLERGAEVEVHEEGIRPWSGRVLSVKWSSVSGWHADIVHEDGGVWVVGLGWTKVEVIA